MKPEHAIDLFNVVSFIFSILLFFGVLQTEEAVFQKISFVVKIVVGCLLIYKFNDFYPQKQFTILDRKVCFLAGTYVIAFTLGDYVSRHSDTANKILNPILEAVYLLRRL
jgi:hypothetical protein